MKVNKVNYIARINPFSPNNTGGGEAVMSALLRYATAPLTKRVDNLKVITPDNIYDYMPDADINIFADVFNLPGSPGFDWEWLEAIMSEEIPYVHFNNAYCDVCCHDYFACENLETETPCNEMGAELMKNADLVYFVSPLHRKKIMEKIPELVMEKTAVLRPLIDTEEFVNKEFGDRDIDYLYVAPLLSAKGFFNVMDYLAEQEADPDKCLIVGANPHKFNLGGMQYRERIPYEDMPFIFNKAKVFVHLPDWPEPMGRTVIEAAMCGCHLVVTENVGALSFGFEDLSNPDNYEGAIEEFWENVLKV